MTSFIDDPKGESRAVNKIKFENLKIKMEKIFFRVLILKTEKFRRMIHEVSQKIFNRQFHDENSLDSVKIKRAPC